MTEGQNRRQVGRLNRTGCCAMLNALEEAREKGVGRPRFNPLVVRFSHSWRQS